MKKKLLSASVVLLVMGATLAFAGAPHRLVYGYFLNYDNLGTYGLARFHMDDASNVEFLEYGDGTHGAFCGACAHGIMYLCEYEYSLTEGPIPSGFYSYNLSTGKKTFVGKYSDGEANPQLKFIDMTYDYSTETMYAIGFEMGVTSLYTFDLNTGSPVKVVDLDKNVATLACSMDGKFYGIDQLGVLYSIGKADGRCVSVLDTGYSGMLSNQSIEFDHTTGDLYWASAVVRPSERYGKTYLVKIGMSVDKPAMEDIAEIGDGAQLMALYIPFVKAGENAPKAPADVKVVPGGNGALNATVTWKNPTQTFGEADLSDLKSVTIKRGDKIIKTVATSEPGKEMSFQDTGVPAGDYRYTVYATNGAGDGEEAYAFAYVGHDCPASPANVTVSPADGCKAGMLSWEKPEEGFHDGYFTDKGLTYRVVRYPDEVEIVKGLTETSYTDNTMRRLGNYYYEVYACNEYGETAGKTNSLILGPALNVTADAPLVEDFSSREYFENRWTAVDGNNDSYSWTFNTQAPAYQFGSSAMGAEYFINPGLPNKGNGADEWLITPPINFKAGRRYDVVISVRVVKEENVAITVGTTNSAAGHTVAGSLVIRNENPEQLPVPFAEYKVQLPEVAADYTGCVGLHLTTPYPSSGFSFFHMTSFTVMEASVSGIEITEADGGADSRRIYNLDGQYVGTSLDGLKKGIYLRNGKKLLVK